MFYVYVLLSKSTQKLYIGQTSNLELRIKAHNEGFSPWTRNKGPWELIHYEEFGTRSEAIRREKFLKSGLGRRWLKERLSKNNSMG